MTALVTAAHFQVSDLERMAVAFAKSKLFGIQNSDQALALCLVAQAEGRHPATAAQDYSIIQGRPAKKADAMLRDFIASGGKVEWHRLDNEKADATFSHPGGGSVRIDWTLERARDAGLGGNAMYKKYPRQMLRARTVSEGVRTVCPGATSGMYVPEEVQDFDEPRDARQPALVETVREVATSEEMAISHLRSCAIDREMFKEAWEKNRAGWRGVMDADAYARVVAEMKRLAATLCDELKPKPADDLNLDGDAIPAEFA